MNMRTIFNPELFNTILEKLEGTVVTVQKSDETCQIMNTFQEFESYQDEQFYYFGEADWKISKQDIQYYDIFIDSITLHMRNGGEIIITAEFVLDD